MIVLGAGCATAQGTLAELRQRAEPGPPRGRAVGMSTARPHFAALGVPDSASGPDRFRALATIALDECGASSDTPIVLATCNGGADALDLADWRESFAPRRLLGRDVAAVVSGSCASGLQALWMARALLGAGASEVVALAVDILSPANEANFDGLRVLADGVEAPLSANRTGFLLGEAAVAIRVASGGAGVSISEPLLGRDDWDALTAASAAAAADGAAECIVQGGGPALADAEELRLVELCGLGKVHPIADVFGHTLGASSLLAAVLALPPAPRWLASAAPPAVLSRALGGQVAALVPGAHPPSPTWGPPRPGGALFSPDLQALAAAAANRAAENVAALVVHLDRPIEPPPRARVGGRLLPSAAVEITPGHAALTAARACGYHGPAVSLIGDADAALDAIGRHHGHSGAVAVWRLRASSAPSLSLR